MGPFDPQAKFNELTIEVLGHVALRFEQGNPGKSKEYYVQEVWPDLAKNLALTGASVLQRALQLSPAERELKYPDFARAVTEGFLVEAIQASQLGYSGLAYYLISRASYWCGVMHGQIHSEELQLRAVGKVISAEGARGGGGKKAELSKQLKAETYRLAAEYRQTRSDGFKSPRDAAARLWKQVRDFGQKNGIKMKYSEERFPGTVAGYFSELPEDQFRNLFPNSDLPRRLQG